MTRKYTKEFLISELQRFVVENGRVPKQIDMQPKFGYPSSGAYTYYFGSFNNGLKIAKLEINKKQHIGKLDGTETCFHCNKRADEIPGFRQWAYPDGIRYCHKHGHSGTGGIPDYVKGQLDINCPTGRGRAGEITVVKALKIGDEFDCNRISCGYKIDLYHDGYKKIDVKTSVLNNKWTFIFNAKKVADTYICIGMFLDTKQVEHVWIVSNINEIRDLQTFTIMNSIRSLKNRSKWEVDPEIYDNAWQDMLLNYTDDKCKVFSKKEETEEEKQKSLQIRKELIERLGLKGNYLLGDVK